MRTGLYAVTVLVSLSLLPKSVAAKSYETWICLKNTTSEKKLILIDDVDGYDWDGLSRPDRNWNGTYVEAGGRRCERAEINYYAAQHSFSFIIAGRSETHKVRMSIVDYDDSDEHIYDYSRWSVFIGNDPSWSPIRGDQADGLQKSGWEAGGPCSSVTSCKEFNFKIVDVP
jgi:Carbohydrate binding domain (family 11)